MGKTAITPQKRTRVADRIERGYRLYRIVAGDLGDRCKAVAYLGFGSIAPIEPVEASNVEEAIALMEAALDARLLEMQRRRRGGIPTVAEFREAIAALPTPVREDIRSLQIERLDPLSSQSVLEALSRRMQVDVQTITDKLRKVARKLGELLDAKPEGIENASDPLLLLVCIVAETDLQAAPVPVFCPEFREAIATLPPERHVAVVRRR